MPNGNYECLITNLDRKEFSTEKLKTLYKMRWGIETSFRKLKYTIGMSNLHSKNPEYICQEIFGKLILYNFCEIIASHVVLEQRNKNMNTE
ncbi:MAG: transposase [Dorea longicatena]